MINVLFYILYAYLLIAFVFSCLYLLGAEMTKTIRGPRKLTLLQVAVLSMIWPILIKPLMKFLKRMKKND